VFLALIPLIRHQAHVLNCQNLVAPKLVAYSTTTTQNVQARVVRCWAPAVLKVARASMFKIKQFVMGLQEHFLSENFALANHALAHAVLIFLSASKWIHLAVRRWMVNSLAQIKYVQIQRVILLVPVV
jgi:hypothetical protein